MKQKEIWNIHLDPIKGREQMGFRPAVIISGNAMNDNLDVLIVCPLTTSIKNYKGCLLLKKNTQNKLTKDSEVLTFHVRSISKERLIKKVGEISDDQLKEIKMGLIEILHY